VNEDQPLLVVGRKNSSITYLLPELCYIIGISNDMLKDFNLLKSIYSFYCEPYEYISQSIRVITDINDTPFARDWGISFSLNAELVKGVKLNSGNLILRNSKSCIDTIQSFEKELQKGMIASLNLWGVLFSTVHKAAKDSLLNEIQSIVNILHIPCKPAKLVEISNDEYSTWIEQIKAIPPNVEALLILIPGNKSFKPSLHGKLKRFFLLNKSILTQFLMASTLEKGKNI